MNDVQNHYVEGKKSDKKEHELYNFICENSPKCKLIYRDRTNEWRLGTGVAGQEQVWKGQERRVAEEREERAYAWVWVWVWGGRGFTGTCVEDPNVSSRAV